mmetsp:Transcript_21041/g.34804  ORF Transcript_21041/g.34804 Transcript_21041/m.34804 type:complete len:531 (-) Transcript_21041:175-1767(-)|eukprot:CAMPEP_0119005864 /NCGR_PEP_ID=MMETSP1176-20130426/1971_1 /TAXON_ID=265551 /ORGANISM="Synedropsis recta cf, Strain CCMP1620" /LENGTH=530 /DNA_ID=CAMNT_0006957719 /DNA_START=129 /DNA_END=1721 /DNA_ORIENTATION=+
MPIQPQSTVKRALCIADSETISVINDTVELLGWRLDCVETVSQAVNSLENDLYEAIIVAVATDRFTLFDSTIVEKKHSTYMSSLLLAAGSKSPSTFRIVFGVQTEFPDVRMTCINCGADAAINSSEALFSCLFGFMTPPPEDVASRGDNSNDMDGTSSRREKQLIEIAGGVMTRRLEKKALQTADLKKQVSEVTSDGLICPKGVMRKTPNDSMDDGMNTGRQISEQAYEMSKQVHQGRGSGHAVRVVTVSNTNGKHRSLLLPEGDIFLHAGNFTDGRTMTCLEQFRDFLLWLEEDVLPQYHQVAFIAGNQEFFLDLISCKYNAVSREAQKILNKFLSKHRAVAFLENTTITYHGLRIHGTSTTLMKGTRRPVADQTPLVNGGSLIRAFERALNNFVPPDDCQDECDILLTHRPPSHIFTKATYELPTDHLYEGYVAGKAARLKQIGEHEPEKRHKRGFFRKKKPLKSPTPEPIKNNKQPPRLHAFGHYGKDFGMEDNCGTLLLNGSQDRVFREDKYGGGMPLVVDLPLYR